MEPCHGTMTEPLSAALVATAIADLTRASSSVRTTVGSTARTTVAAICAWLRTLEDVTVDETTLRQALAALPYNLRMRVVDGVAAAPPAAPPVARTTVTRHMTVTLQLALAADGTLEVERVSAPSGIAVRADAEFRGTDAELPLHVFVRTSR